MGLFKIINKVTEVSYRLDLLLRIKIHPVYYIAILELVYRNLSGILLQSPWEALRGALGHPSDGCRSRAGGTCLQYIDLLDPRGLTSSRICLLYNLSYSTFTPSSLLPISPLTFKSLLLLLKGQLALKNQIIYLYLLFIPTILP